MPTTIEIQYPQATMNAINGPNATLTFLCELGPAPYAITGPDGKELSDRWNDALVMKDMIRKLWERIAEET